MKTTPVSKTVLVEKAQNPFKSTNFTLQTLLLLVFAVLELIGFPIEVANELKVFIEATLIGAIGFWGTIREWISKGVQVAWNGNVLTYVLAFAAAVVPWLAQYTDELSTGISGVIEAIGSGNFTMIFTAVFTLGNIIWQIVQGRKRAEIA